MTTFLIPLVNTPQTFQISLGGVNYSMTSKWNDADEGGWIIDLADVDGNPIVAGVPMITGADLLANLGYLGIEGELVVFTDGDETAVPTLENLGVESNLYFQSDVANG
jgi:hypothetical protein